MIIPMLKNRGNCCAAMIHVLLLSTPAFATCSEGQYGVWEYEYPAESNKWHPCLNDRVLYEQWISYLSTDKPELHVSDPQPFLQAPEMDSTCLEANQMYYLEVKFNEDPNSDLHLGYEGHFDWGQIEKHYPDFTASDLRKAAPPKGKWKRTRRWWKNKCHRVRRRMVKGPPPVPEQKAAAKQKKPSSCSKQVESGALALTHRLPQGTPSAPTNVKGATGNAPGAPQDTQTATKEEMQAIAAHAEFKKAVKDAKPEPPTMLERLFGIDTSTPLLEAQQPSYGTF